MTRSGEIVGPTTQSRSVASLYGFGLLATLAGWMLAAQLLEGSSLIWQCYEINSIAAVVVGGASLFGGSGDLIRVVSGGLIIATILNIMI